MALSLPPDPRKTMHLPQVPAMENPRFPKLTSMTRSCTDPRTYRFCPSSHVCLPSRHAPKSREPSIPRQLSVPVLVLAVERVLLTPGRLELVPRPHEIFALEARSPRFPLQLVPEEVRSPPWTYLLQVVFPPTPLWLIWFHQYLWYRCLNQDLISCHGRIQMEGRGCPSPTVYTNIQRFCQQRSH